MDSSEMIRKRIVREFKQPQQLVIEYEQSTTLNQIKKFLDLTVCDLWLNNLE